MQTDWVQILQYSFQALWVEVVSFVPQLVVALAIVIVGWILGGVLKNLIERVFKVMKLNEALGAAGVDTLVKRAGYTLKAGAFIGGIVKWFVIIVFFVAALDVLNLDQVTVFFRDVVLGYLPNVVVAVLVLFVAMVVANIVDKTIVAAAHAADFYAADFLGTFARYAIITFAILAALSQLRIAPELVQMLFAGIVFAASLALGLAFGLGGREAASRYIERMAKGPGGHSHVDHSHHG
jgi:small-conductance mechanosensitive channel